jgi:tRNA (mo5U34)-methyltransferase
MTEDDLATQVRALNWFHSIDLGNGLITPGIKSLATIRAEQRIFFDPIALAGASVLDVGAWNGAYSFEAARRGAKVLATDNYVWTHDAWRGREGFDIANKALGLRIEAKVIDVPDITITNVGLHDVVLFLGVLYHLPSPLTLLQSVAQVAKECLVVETHADLMDIDKPALAYYPGATLNGDPTNFFGPNPAFVIEALKECGFKLFDTHYENTRLTVHAWRTTSLRKMGDQPESHTVVTHTATLKRRLKRALDSLWH